MTFFNKTSACALSLFAVLFTTSIYNMDIFKAAEKGDIARIKRLIAANPNVVNQQAGWGVTPLHWAAGNGHQAVAQILIDNKANVNQQDVHGFTPLHFAAFNNHQAAARILIANGANVNQKDNDGWTSLHWAEVYNHQAVVKILITNGANVNLQDNKGRTPLHEVAFHGHLTAAQILIANGANVNLQNSAGDTPLQLATFNRDQNIVDLINRVNAATAFAKTQLLALLCAGHPRLGVSSPLQPILQDSQQVTAKIIGQFVRRGALENALYPH